MNAITLLVASLLSLNAGQQTKSCLSNCATSEAGVEFITHFEGYSPFVYKDSAGLDTIGVGHLIVRGEKFSEPFLPDESDALLRKDLKSTEKSVNLRVKVELLQHQADSVISFTFNLGEGRLARSTLLKRINANLHNQVPVQFLSWNKAVDPKTGQLVVVKGLQVRREAESTMYRGG